CSQFYLHRALLSTCSSISDPAFYPLTAATEVYTISLHDALPILRIAGTAEFALEKRTVSVDENGTATGGVVDGASLLTVALTVKSGSAHVCAVVTRSARVQSAVGNVTPAGQTAARYTGFKMGDVT